MAEIMDEIVGSCIVCGQTRKFVVWHNSGITGICSPCHYKATAEGGGYVLRHSRHGSLFKNRVYSNWTDAKTALDGIVWHSKDGWEIRPLMIGALEASRAPTGGDRDG